MHVSYIFPYPTPVASTNRTNGPEPFDTTLARVLDRQADHALHLGYRLQAERLAHRAAELREAGR